MPFHRPSCVGRVNRESSAAWLRFSHKCHLRYLTRRSTRCCDAQGAGALFSQQCHFTARRGGRVNRERRACGRVIRINAIIIEVPVVVPVVVMLRAPVPLFCAKMPFCRPSWSAALIVRRCRLVYSQRNAISLPYPSCYPLL